MLDILLTFLLFPLSLRAKSGANNNFINFTDGDGDRLRAAVPTILASSTVRKLRGREDVGVPPVGAPAKALTCLALVVQTRPDSSEWRRR